MASNLDTLINKSVPRAFRGRGTRVGVVLVCLLTALIVILLYTINMTYEDKNEDGYVGPRELKVEFPAYEERPWRYLAVGAVGGYIGLVMTAYVRDRKRRMI